MEYNPCPPPILNRASITGVETDPVSSNDTNSERTTVNRPVVDFYHGVYSVTENCGQATISVTLNMTPVLPVTVDYATSDNTALAGSDYTAVSGALTFAAGVTYQEFTVDILQDSQVEGDESLWLTLSNVGNATIGPHSPMTLTILANNSKLLFRHGNGHGLMP